MKLEMKPMDSIIDFYVFIVFLSFFLSFFLSLIQIQVRGTQKLIDFSLTLLFKGSNVCGTRETRFSLHT